jgi:orotidine-5'-phosphate decarboxylase
MNSFTKLTEITKKNSSLLCVGLDTDIKKIPAHLGNDIDNLFVFNREIIEATKDLVCSYKINFAFYEQYGAKGFDILKKTIDAIPEDIFIIADAKRGDIGNTSSAYARSCFEYFRADSITVNPYMGFDSVKPFLEFEDKFVFLLALTSNPGSNDFQRLVSEGKPLYKHVIEKSQSWASHENLGFVVGATHPSELEEVRDMAKENVLLIPGVGTQGGDVEAVLKANRGGHAVINVSRAVIYASGGTDFAEKAREKAVKYSLELRNKS